jgi:hypothetical protein
MHRTFHNPVTLSCATMTGRHPSVPHALAPESVLLRGQRKIIGVSMSRKRCSLFAPRAALTFRASGPPLGGRLTWTYADAVSTDLPALASAAAASLFCFRPSARVTLSVRRGSARGAARAAHRLADSRPTGLEAGVAAVESSAG